jgi:hypothetical protein
MNESIIVGLVVGVGVAAAGAIVGHFLRLREMKEQWSEDEQRRKSERRRELLENELAVITDFADAYTDFWTSIDWWSPTGKLLTLEAKAELGKEAFLMHARANIAALSIRDRSLKTGVKKLVELWRLCNTLLDPGTSQPHEGKEGEYRKALVKMRTTAADIRRRGRKLLEEV